MNGAEITRVMENAFNAVLESFAEEMESLPPMDAGERAMASCCVAYKLSAGMASFAETILREMVARGGLSESEASTLRASAGGFAKNMSEQIDEMVASLNSEGSPR